MPDDVCAYCGSKNISSYFKEKQENHALFECSCNDCYSVFLEFKKLKFELGEVIIDAKL